MIKYNPLISNKIEQKIPEALSVGTWFKGDIFTPLLCKFLPLEVNLSLVENHRSKVFNGHHSVSHKVDLGTVTYTYTSFMPERQMTVTYGCTFFFLVAYFTRYYRTVCV